MIRAITPQYLRMGKQDQAKLIQWMDIDIKQCLMKKQLSLCWM